MPTELTPLLRYCLDTTAAQLSDEFHGVFSPETVRRYVETSYADIGDRTDSRAELPAGDHRAVRPRAAMGDRPIDGGGREAPSRGAVRVRAERRAQPNGRVSRPSPVQGWIAVRSAGSHPDEQIDPTVVGAMREIGLDVSHRVPQAAHRRRHPRRGRSGHSGVRRRVPGVPGQALPGLARRRSCRSGD